MMLLLLHKANASKRPFYSTQSAFSFKKAKANASERSFYGTQSAFYLEKRVERNRRMIAAGPAVLFRTQNLK